MGAGLGFGGGVVTLAFGWGGAGMVALGPAFFGLSATNGLYCPAPFSGPPALSAKDSRGLRRVSSTWFFFVGKIGFWDRRLLSFLQLIRFRGCTLRNGNDAFRLYCKSFVNLISKRKIQLPLGLVVITGIRCKTLHKDGGRWCIWLNWICFGSFRSTIRGSQRPESVTGLKTSSFLAQRFA